MTMEDFCPRRILAADAVGEAMPRPTREGRTVVSATLRNMRLAILGGALLLGACTDTPSEGGLDAGSGGPDGSRVAPDGRVVAPDGSAASCSDVPEGSSSACGDGCDNDGDSMVDCDDPDCASDAACLPPPPEPSEDDIPF